jgi:1-acyl-sn-glycerol-3-phosphate acyltransferase
LGPDWKFDKTKSYQGAGAYVANHQSFCDIFVQLCMHNPTPGYVAKAVVKNIFLIGKISDIILNSLFV